MRNSREDERERSEKAKEDREKHILMEARIRGDFHRALKRWLELIAPSPADIAELERMYALDAKGPLESEKTDNRD
jgi:hypothetical protein